MDLLKELHKLQEEAAAGAISAGSVAVNQGTGFSKGDQALGSKPSKGYKHKKIKKIFKEDKQFDQINVMAQIKNAENTAEANKQVTGFALEDESGNIVKIYVKTDQAADFEQALNSELSKNQNDEYQHREIGEIIYDLKNDFDIINIDMGEIPEDEEELEDIESSEDSSELELEDGESEDTIDGDEVTPETDAGEEDAKSALNAVIDMMKADAEAKKAEADAKTKAAEADIAKLNTQAAEAQVKKSEEVMDMEAHYSKQASQDKEAKELAKLAQYRHEMTDDGENANTDYIETDIEDTFVADENEEAMELKASNDLLKGALTVLLRNSIAQN